MSTPNLHPMPGLQRLMEGGLFLTFLFSLFILLALGSFDPADPGWSQTVQDAPVNNIVGTVGAWTADVLFFIFGITAYAAPIICSIIGVLIFRKKPNLLEVDYFSIGLRIIGFILFMLSFAALSAMNADEIFYYSAGGVVGDVISTLMLPYFNLIGTTLLLLCVLCASFTLMTGLSWIDIIEWIGSKTLDAFSFIGSLPQRIFGAPAENEDTQKFTKVVDHFKAKRLADEWEEADRLNKETNAKVIEPTFGPIPPEFEPTATSMTPQIEPLRVNIDARSASEPVAPSADIQLDIEPSQPKVDTQPEVEPLQRKVDAQPEIKPVSASVNIQPEVEPELKPEPANTHIDAEPAPVHSANESAAIVDQHNQTPTKENKVQERAKNYSQKDKWNQDLDWLSSTPKVDHVPNEEDLQPIPPWVTKEELFAAESLFEPAGTTQEQLEPYIQEALHKAGLKPPQAPSVPITPMPVLSLLDEPRKSTNAISEHELETMARLVETKLLDFNISAQVVDVHPGPVITRFELELAPGMKVSKISNLSKDLARELSAVSVRVVESIPGKSVIGLELPNAVRETVFLREVLDCKEFEENKSDLTMVLGQDIAGEPVVVDLAKMPHLLVAGTTGSGKSVGVNVMILSLLYKSTPEDVRLIMIDPKMLELSVYEGIPHLLCEVVTDMKEASNALRWCVGEMERRYKLMSKLGVRNLKGYNAKVLDAKAAGEPILDPFWSPEQSMASEAPELDKLPAIVVVVDEFADMMMIVGKKVEELIARIAQKARAAGIHLILATQRPSVDVITGLIKANIPTRIAFQVSSRIDSRTILDQQGAEQLLGQGDMLYLPAGTSVPTRVHGAFVDDHEVHRVVADWSARAKPQYISEILAGESGGEQVLLPGEISESAEDSDPLYDEAVAFVIETRRASISSVQRKFKIGYNRAARIVEQMEQNGLVSAQGHNGNREVLVPGTPQ